MTVGEWLLSKYSRGASGARPTVLPTLSRRDLPALCRDLRFTHGAEIGVWKGEYSALFCQAAPGLHMRCVDPWQAYDAWADGKNLPEAGRDEKIEDAYRQAAARLATLNATIVRQFSADAAADVPDGSLDLVYIDGNHGRDAVSADLACWSRKVRVGGVVAGHDYRVFEHKPYIQVVEAVQAFTQANGIETWFTTAADRTPSFLWVQV
jgi:predicted O-methyltransferase YrrM